GSGLNSFARRLALDTSLSPPVVYAAGPFSQAGTVLATGVAKWNGTAWSALGTGVTQVTGLSAPGLPGSPLIASGYFSSAGGVPASMIARWDGQQWAALGPG